MKNKNYLIIPAALAMLGTVYCISKHSDSLTSSEKTELAMRSKNFIRRLNRRELDSCYNALSPTMHNNTSIKRFHAVFDPILEHLGELEEFRGGSISKKTYSSGNIYYICNLKCNFKNGRAVFSLIYDEDMEIVELFVK